MNWYQIYIWYGISFMDFIQKKVGNGENTSFWDDSWLGDVALKVLYKRLYALEMCKSISVAEKMGHPSLSHSFRRMPRGGVEQENYGLLCSKVADLVLPNISDRWCWSLEGSQEFSVKSSRILIDNTILPKAEVPTRWLRVVPIKVNVHAWRVCLDKLPTRANLSLRGMDIPSIACPLCNSAVESTSHIFFACPLARQVWRKFLIWWELEDVAFNSYNEWLIWIVNIRLHKQLKVFLEVNCVECTFKKIHLKALHIHSLLKKKMNQSGVIQLGPIDEQTPLSQQQQNITVSVASPRANNSGPNLPLLDLLEGPREDYLKIGVPSIQEASDKCDWKAAKAILDKHPQMKLVRYSITENAETALHVAASAKGPKHVEEFVENLVKLMEKEDLALENKNCNTALYLAAAAGNIKTDLIDDGWTDVNRGWLLEKSVENDMFDIALKIVDKYKKLASNGSLLGVLARKPEAFSIKQHNFIWRFIIWVFTLIGITVGAYEKECKALQLLKIIWGEIAKNNKKEIDNIIRGPADLIKPDNTSTSKRVIQAMQLENLISEHVSKMKDETQNITGGHPDSTNQDPKQNKVDQALKLQQLISKQLINMHAETQKITKEESKQISAKVDQVSELEKLISKHILDMHTETHNIIRGPSAFGQEDQAQHLQNLISTHFAKLLVKTKSIIDRAPAVPAPKPTYSNRVLFVATEMGNTKFLVELIRLYPDLIWKINDNGLSVFHIAVKHRHEGIYNLLHEIGAMKDMITPLRDEHENNMLHLVGKIAKKKRLEDVSGFALQMQRELLWFQEIRNMIPPSYRERKNKDDLTPHELFTKEHKDLVIRGEEWMKGTASQCMVVAALIATIVFAAAFTVPGGYAQSNDQASNQKNGVPVFHSKATFMVFVVADAISLFSSSASILMFLSILTSRYAERDFLESLPKKLMLGLAALFLSITTMTVAFSVSFFVLYHKGLLWIPILISALAVLPVLLYIKLQYGLFVDVIRSTYGSSYLFKPRKHVLYYKNPEV
ncbi:ankyrin repeat-containing domain, PGG domain protein [Tanacetum coccineum]